MVRQELRTGQLGRLCAEMNLFSTSTSKKSVERLSKLDVFSELTFNQVLEVSELLHERVYEKGEIVFEEGDIGHGIYVVVSGKVRAETSRDSLRDAIMDFGPGEALGELSLFEEAPRPATVVAVERTVMVALFRAEFSALLTKNTKIGVKILSKLATTMSQRVRRLLLRESHQPSL